MSPTAWVPVTDWLTLGLLFPSHLPPTAGNVPCRRHADKCQCGPFTYSLPESLRLWAGFPVIYLVTVCPFIQHGREAALPECLVCVRHCASYFYTCQLMSYTQQPHKVDTVSLLVRGRKLELSKFIKQDQGHTDLGSWEESPGLPRPGASALSTMPTHWAVLLRLWFSNTTSRMIPDTVFSIFHAGLGSNSEVG